MNRLYGITDITPYRRRTRSIALLAGLGAVHLALDLALLLAWVARRW